MPLPLVNLMMPMRGAGGQDTEALAHGIVSKCSDAGFDIIPAACWTSLLPYTFNTLWAGAINLKNERGVNYAAMIHDDIVPDKFWLDTLVGILEETGADIVSAVVPIKDNRGLTSTAVDDTDTTWSPRRLAMREVFDLPETFGQEHFPKGQLLLNSGLWVARLDRAWCEQTKTGPDGATELAISFKQRDRIIRTPDGWTPQTKSEDWAFSRSLSAAGCKLLATRKVGLVHERGEWTNRKPWGAWPTDLDCVPQEKHAEVLTAARQAVVLRPEKAAQVA